jgi:hypothetical protein
MRAIAYHNENEISLALIRELTESSTDVERESTIMPFQYIPVMAQNSAPKPPRMLVSPSKPAWWSNYETAERIAHRSGEQCGVAFWRTRSRLFRAKIFGYRRVPSDPSAGEIIIDHHSGIGRVPKQDPEIVFPRTALINLQERGVIGSVAPSHFSFMGGLRDHNRIENELAPADRR